jgi:hypothetical protein
LSPFEGPTLPVNHPEASNVGGDEVMGFSRARRHCTDPMEERMVEPEREQGREAGGDEDAAASLEKARLKNVAPPLGPVLAARGLGPYRGYAELLGQLGGLSTRGYRLHRIGKSAHGEPIFALHLGPSLSRSPERRDPSVHLSDGVEVHLRLLERPPGQDLGDRSTWDPDETPMA